MQNRGLKHQSIHSCSAIGRDLIPLLFVADDGVSCLFDEADSCGYSVWDGNDIFRWERLPKKAVLGGSVQLQHDVSEGKILLILYSLSS